MTRRAGRVAKAESREAAAQLVLMELQARWASEQPTAEQPDSNDCADGWETPPDPAVVADWRAQYAGSAPGRSARDVWSSGPLFLRTHEEKTGGDDTTSGGAMSDPSAGSLAAARFPVLAAVSALAFLGGQDNLLATEIAEALGFGWELEEYELRQISRHVPHVAPSLAAEVLGTLRDARKYDLVLLDAHLLPRHAQFIARALPCAPFLQRLVIHYAFIGDRGATLLAEALAEGGTHIMEVHMSSAYLSDASTPAIAAAIRSPRCRVAHWNLESNRLTDACVDKLGAACRYRLLCGGPLTDFQMGHNFLTPAGVARLTAMMARFEVRLSTRFMKNVSDFPSLPEGVARRLDMLSMRDIERLAVKLPTARF